MPDPGEPPADVDNVQRAAGVVPGSPDGPHAVHLIVWMPPLASDAEGHWSTTCPADVDGVPAGAERRQVCRVVRRIDCLACLVAEPVAAGQVIDAVGAQARRGRAAAAAVLDFLRWARAEKGLLLADYAGGARLKPYPETFDAQFVTEWSEHHDD